MKISELARLLGGTLHGEADREVQEVAGLETAGRRELTFAEDAKSLELAAASQAGCVLVPADCSLPGRATIGVENPKLAFVRAAQALCPPPKFPPGVHPTAVVAADAHLAEDVAVSPCVVIESGVEVGQGTYLGAGVYLGQGARVGAQCTLYPRVCVYPEARIGNRVILHSGVVVGSDGFGYVFAEDHYEKFPQRGSVVIEDDVEIGANATVDRGALDETRICRGTKIDNLVHVGHNCQIGEDVIIAAQTGLSGSIVIENGAVLGGQVGIGEHATIGEGVMLGGQGGVLPNKVLRGKGVAFWGTPAQPLRRYLKQLATLARLAKRD